MCLSAPGTRSCVWSITVRVFLPSHGLPPLCCVSVYLSAGLISTPCSCERVTDRSFVSLRSCRPPSFTAVITPATCAGQNLPFILLLLNLCQCGMTAGLASARTDSLAYCIIEDCCKLEGGFEWTEIRWSSEQCYRCWYDTFAKL